MARKVLNRKELREEADAQQQANAENAVAAKKTAKTTARSKTRAKASKEVRLKAFWGVFSQSLNPVVLFEYSEREKAEQKAQELSESRKSPHFVQLVKNVIEE